MLENTDRLPSLALGSTGCFPAPVETLPAAEGRPCAVRPLDVFASSRLGGSSPLEDHGHFLNLRDLPLEIRRSEPVVRMAAYGGRQVGAGKS